MTSHPDQSTPTPSRASSLWAELPPAAEVKRWEAISPGTVERILTAVEKAARDDRRQQWAEFTLRVFGTLCGLTSVMILALTAKHFVDQGAPIEGVAVFGAGSLSMVTAFITLGRHTK